MRLSLIDNLDSVGNPYYPAVANATIIEKEIWDEAFRAIMGAVNTVSSNTTLTDSHHVVLVDCTAGDVTLTLPSAAPPAGTGSSPRFYRIKKVAGAIGNDVIVQRAGSDTIDGGTSVSIAFVNSAIDLVSDNVSAWAVF